MTKKILPIYGVPPEVKETVTELRETMKACMRDNKRYMDILQQEHDRIIGELRKIWTGPIYTYEQDLDD